MGPLKFMLLIFTHQGPCVLLRERGRDFIAEVSAYGLEIESTSLFALNALA